MKNKNHFLLILLIIIIYWKFFTPGPRVANDFPYIYPEALREAFNLPSTWLSRGGEGMGELGILTMWAWPIDFLYGLAGKFGLTFEILERLVGVAVIILGIFSIKTLLRKYGVKGLSADISSLFYLTTTYLILLIDGGQIQIALAYAWLPMSFYLLTKATRSDLKQKLYSAFSVIVLGLFDIRFIYVLLLLYGNYFLYELLFAAEKKRLLFDFLKTGTINLIVYTGINFYWILPLVLTQKSSLTNTFSKLTEAQALNFTTMGHAVYLLQPHWFKNVFGKITNLRLEFVVIPFLVFIAPLTKRNKNIGFWLVAGLMGLFLVKGSNPPLGHIYTWLFTNIPGFSLFRDSTKFFFLVSLAYSILIGYTVQEIIKRVPWKFNLGSTKVRLIPVVLLVYLILIVNPVWSGNMTGTLSDPINKEEFFKVAETLKNDTGFGRVFWNPSRPPLGYSSSTHPIAEALRMVEKRPFMIGTVGTYEILNFLREANFMGELFSIFGIKYLVYPYPDTRREEISRDAENYYQNFSDQISKLGWLGEKVSDFPLNAYKVRNSLDKFFVAENTWLVIGSDRIYEEFGDKKYGNLSDNALIFAEENHGAIKYLVNENINILNYESGGNINNPDFDESLYTFTKPVHLSNFLTENPEQNNGWWMRRTSDFLWLRNFLQTKYGIDYQEFDYGGGIAISEGPNKLTIKTKDLGVGEYVFVRALQSSKGGSIKLYQDDNYLGEIITQVNDQPKVVRTLSGYKDVPSKNFEYEKGEFITRQSGRLDPQKHYLTIETKGDINIINFISTTSYAELHDQNYQLKPSFNWNNIGQNEKEVIFKTNNNIKVVYEKISQTHYKVEVQGLKKPSTLVFSESYNPMWELDGTAAYPVYSSINGFYVENDGEYNIFFKPQKYVIYGLFIGAFTLISCALLLIILPKKKK